MHCAESPCKKYDVETEVASAAGEMPRQGSSSQSCFRACNSNTLAASVLEIDLSTKVGRPWLRTDRDCGRIYGEKTGHCLDSECATYFTMSADAEHALLHATNELHKLFLCTTAYVLEGRLGEAAPEQFDIPAFLWPQIQAFWQGGGGYGDDLVIARFDMALTAQGPKCYEYNCDSSSCLFECAYTQEAYTQAVGAVAGRSAGHGLHQRLVDTCADVNSLASCISCVMMLTWRNGTMQSTWRQVFCARLLWATPPWCCLGRPKAWATSRMLKVFW